MPNQYTANNRQRNYQFLLDSIRNHNSDECLIWPFSRNVNGYGQCKFGNCPVLVHRLSFYFTHGRWPQPEGRHSCDVPACFNPRHIIEGTQRDNIADMISRGRSTKGRSFNLGVDSVLAKLDENAVRMMREEYTPVLGIYARLAEKFHVNCGTVHNVINRRTWKHIK